MTFLFPAMFAAAAALAVPVILHLIAQQRFPIQPIPNIRLVQTERRTNAYAVRPVDLWQLLLRLLVVALVALAMARPTAPSFVAGRSARNLVVVLDCSPSMLAAGQGAPSSFVQARAKAVDLLSSATSHDDVAYIEAGSSARIVSPLVAAARGPAQAAARARVSYGGGGSIAQALAQACRMLASRKEAFSEIYVLSDMRCNALDGWDERNRALFAAVRRRMGDRLKVHLVNFSPTELANVGIVDAKLSPGRISTGAAAHLAATVRNVSDEEKEVTVGLAVRNTAKKQRTVKIPARSEAIVDLATTFDAAVNTFCTVELSPADALAIDDTSWVPVRLDPRFEVLIIDGSRAQRPALPGAEAAARPTPGTAGGLAGASGARMLEFALNPAQFAASEGRGRTRNSFVKRISLSAVSTAMMGTSRLVVLYNIDRLPQRTMEDLRDFIKSGRSVLIIPGDGVNLIEFRSAFVKPPEAAIRLCPAAVDNAVPVEPGTKVTLGDNIHPVMEPFRDPRKGDLTAIQFKRLRRLRPAAGARVIFSVGEMPAAVEMQALVPGDTPEQAPYRGRVCVLGFGLEPGWSNIALTRVFVPLIWRLTDHVAGRLGALPVDVARSGERAVLDCSDFAPSPSVAVFGPDDRPLRADDGWPLEVPLSSTDSAVVTDLSTIGAYKVVGPGQVTVEVRRADGELVCGTIQTAVLQAAIRNKVDSLILAGSKINRADVAGASFRKAVTVKNVGLILANGSSITGGVPAGVLDDALGGRVNEMTIVLNDGVRKVPADAVKSGRFADALELGAPGAAAGRARFIGVNLPPGETDTAPMTREALEASLGDGGWDLVTAKEIRPTAVNAVELWYLVAIGLLLAYLAEAAVGHWLSYRRERTRVG